jgi:hypothetical protein
MRIRWTAHVSCIGNMANAYKMLDVKPEGKGPLKRRRRIGG